MVMVMVLGLRWDIHGVGDMLGMIGGGVDCAPAGGYGDDSPRGAG
jgi:hypothetical protein